MPPRTKQGGGPGVHALLEQGIPAGPLAQETDVFYQVSTGAKYHADRYCNRAGPNSPDPVRISLATTPDTAYCTSCVTEPVSARSQRYVQDATRILTAQRLYDALTAGPADENDPRQWRKAAFADAILYRLESIPRHDEAFAALVTHSHDLHTQARRLRDQIRSETGGPGNDAAVLRRCAIDLLGTIGERADPSDARPTVDAPESLPALCTPGSKYLGPVIGGYKDTILTAWRQWRTSVADDGDLPAARADAIAAAGIDTLEPGVLAAMPKGPARTPHPAGGSPWDWLVAEWRHAAVEELTTVISSWEQAYAQTLTGTGSRMVSITGLTLEMLISINVSTALLAQLPMVWDKSKRTALLTVPAPVADWLKKFGVTGRTASPETRKSVGRPRETAEVHDLGPARASDDADVLTLALKLWEPAGNGAPVTPRSDLANVVDIARGISRAAA